MGSDEKNPRKFEGLQFLIAPLAHGIPMTPISVPNPPGTNGPSEVFKICTLVEHCPVEKMHRCSLNQRRRRIHAAGQAELLPGGRLLVNRLSVARSVGMDRVGGGAARKDHCFPILKYLSGLDKSNSCQPAISIRTRLLLEVFVESST